MKTGALASVFDICYLFTNTRLGVIFDWMQWGGEESTENFLTLGAGNGVY